MTGRPAAGTSKERHLLERMGIPIREAMYVFALFDVICSGLAALRRGDLLHGASMAMSDAGE